MVGKAEDGAGLRGDVAAALKLALSAWRCNAITSTIVVAGAAYLNDRI
jgi:hypothetical protein